MTISDVRKNIDKEMQNLTPAELARYIILEEERLVKKQAAGEDVANEDEQMEILYKKYVLSKDIRGYAAFWRAMYNEEKEHWGRWWLELAVPALDRERSLISLLLLEKVRSWVLAKGKKNDPIWEERRRQIAELLKRHVEIVREIEIIFSSDIWEVLKIERPDIPTNYADERWIDEANEIVRSSEH
jgi:hypothetical protein